MREFIIVFGTWVVFMVACAAFVLHFNIAGLGSFLSGIVFGGVGAFLGVLIANS